ncbi:MAG TPA: hypothetical protein VFB84_11325 [Micromonosporaceae bacterium]|nr:hypothetical protein [Micromonosporaceae bacterium]
MELWRDDAAPVWRPAYDHLSIGADHAGMAGVAAALRAELAEGFLPERDLVDADMTVPAAAPATGFVELLEFLTRHRESQQVLTALLAEHGNATGALAAGAEVASQRYGDADRLAAGRAEDVA